MLMIRITKYNTCMPQINGYEPLLLISIEPMIICLREPTVGDGHWCAITLLLLPGKVKVLHLNALIHKRAFRSMVNKAGAWCNAQILNPSGTWPRNNNFQKIQRGANMVINI